MCGSHISGTLHLIHFTLGMCIDASSRKCSVKFGAIWTCDTFNIYYVSMNRLTVLWEGDGLRTEPNVSSLASEVCLYPQAITDLQRFPTTFTDYNQTLFLLSNAQLYNLDGYVRLTHMEIGAPNQHVLSQ